MPQKWDYFRLGPKPAAALTILKIEVVGLLQHETKYQIRYDCCGEPAVLTHTQIKARVRKSNFKCGKCSHSNSARLAKKAKADLKKKRDAAKHGVRVSGGRDFPAAPMPPPWPASKSAQELWKKDAKFRRRW